MKNDSPLFISALDRFEKGDLSAIDSSFRRVDKKNLIQERHGRREYIPLNEFREKIHNALVVPLFIKPGINVRAPGPGGVNKKNNLYVITSNFHRDLINLRDDASDGSLHSVVSRFRREVREIVPGINPPFGFALEAENPETSSELKREMDDLNSRIENLRNQVIADFGKTVELHFRDLQSRFQERDRVAGRQRRAAADDVKMGLLIEQMKGMLAYLKFARGKPGRHPKPYNVFVYHLINEFAKWKFDWKKRLAGQKDCYLYRHDGQHKFEYNWPLILAMLFDVHFRSGKIPELSRFINRFRKRPSAVALQALKQDLWDRYKNFPPKQGWPGLSRGREETGFKKLIVDDAGALFVVSL